MVSESLRYEVVGHDMQLVRIEMDPGQTLVAEAGAMVYMDEGIEFEARMGDGTEPADQGMMGALVGLAKRAATGAGVFLTHYSNRTSSVRRIHFGAARPGKIVAVDLEEWGGQILCEHRTFLCAEFGTHVTVAWTQRLATSAFGGAGFILQKLEGRGKVFLHACGSVIDETLDGGSLLIEPGALVAFSPSLAYDIQKAGNLKTMLFGGEGLFLATLKGSGRVFLQSLPWSRVVHEIVEQVPSR